ncbi:MAG: sensor signal transduction histidine kinase, partial [Deltaproteobacteria bacterium]|nr:sensor signal transduction histidine kinase [Deltaproteobacteria bacterium]
ELIRKDGTKRILETSVSLLRDSKGRPVGFYGIGRDITERKQAEEELRTEKQRFQNLSENAPFGMVMIDQDGTFRYINPKFRELFGYDLADIPNGKTWFRKAYPEATYRYHVFSAWKQDFKSMKPGEKGSRVFTVTCKDGTEKIINFIPVQLETGENVMACEDITERKQAEAALKESEGKYRAILNSIEEGYYEVDLAGNFTFFNNFLVKSLGYTKEELMGLNNRHYMSPETALLVFKTFNEVYRTGNPKRDFEWELINKDGSKRFVEVSVSLMRNEKGQPKGFYGIARDITERKQIEEESKVHQEQMMQASKMVALGTLVSSMAHEINNPNNFIMLNTPLLQEAWENSKPILEEYYEKNGDFIIGGMRYTEMRENIPVLFSGIVDGSKRIKQIVEDLRNFARREASDMTQSVDVNAVLKSAVTLLSNMLMKSTNHFSIDYGNPLPLLKGNFQRLEQVIINLIQNACQALRDAKKSILVTTSYDEKREGIIIRVEDEGIGIPPKILPHITDSFFTTKVESGGTGLGLSISSRIVKEHGGTLTFESEVRKGTKAEIFLPLYRTEKALEERAK